MTPSDLLATLSRLHLTPPEAARLLGYNKTSVYRWIRGDATVPPAVERLLWLMESYPGVQVMLGRVNADVEAEVSWELMGGKRRFPQHDVKP